MALIAAGMAPQTVRAADYSASNEAELRSAITNATEPSTITLTADIALASTSNFTAPQPITIITNGHSLSGLDAPPGGPPANRTGGDLAFNGAFAIINSGDLRGGAGDSISGGSGGRGLALGTGSALTNNGTITGGAAAGGFAGGVGAQLTGMNNINNGTIRGGAGPAGSGGPGMNLGTGSLTNYGLIEGGAGNGSTSLGMSLSGPTTVTNNGTIRGGASPVPGTGHSAITAISGTHTITNNGTIEGGTGGHAIFGNFFLAQFPNFNIVNDGTIKAGAGQTDAIRLTAATGTNVLELHSNSVIVGNVVMTAGAGDTLRLAGTNNGTFDASAIGAAAQYRNFDAYQKTDTSTWTLTGTTSAVTPWQLQGGTLSISSDGALGDTTGALTFDGGALQNTAAFSSARNATINAGGGTFETDADLTWSGVIGGTGTLNKTGAGKLDLTGDSSAFAGTTNVAAGSLAVNGMLGGDLNVLAGGRLQGTGVVANTNNFGVIAPGNSIGKLLIAGDYAGSGGVLEIETVLAGTGSPADRLVVAGNVTGTTTIQTINLGGTGALTGSTNTDGVSIVQVGGTSSASAFQLAGGYAAAGPYRYTLVAFDPASSAGTEADALFGGPTPFWDYRLQSLVDASGNPVPVPQIGAYQGTPSGALRYGSEQFDSLHERLGEIRHAAELRAASDTRDKSGEFFFRQNHSWSDISGEKAAGYDQETWFVQFGGTLVGWDVGNRGDTLRGGAAISIGGSDLDVNNSSASVDLKGTSLALTSTYQASEGWYVDGLVQGTRFSADVATAERGQVGEPSGWGAGASVAGGYPFDLGDRLIVEPQAQLAYQQVWFDSFTDVDGIAVDLQGGESLRGRVGGRLQKTYVADSGATLWSPFVAANLLHEFLNGGGITASGVTFQSDNGGTSMQFGGGLNAQFGGNMALFGNVSYEKAVTDDAADSWSGTIGLRMDF